MEGENENNSEKAVNPFARVNSGFAAKGCRRIVDGAWPNNKPKIIAAENLADELWKSLGAVMRE